MAMTMASPTVASAAATAMTNSAMTGRGAASDGMNAPKATMARFTRVEHQLDGHEHGDGVAPGQEAEGADGEQERRQRQVRVERLAHGSSAGGRSLAAATGRRSIGLRLGLVARARKTPPMTAARSSTLTTSKAST